MPPADTAGANERSMTARDQVDASRPSKGEESVLLIACGALAREILEIKHANGWDHLKLLCLPADLHLYPDRIPDRVEEAVTNHREHYEQIFVVYADCGTGGLLRSRCDQLGVEMVEGPHCYSFYEGNREFARHAEDETTAFYLTDFLVRQFDSFVWKPLGLDRHPQLRDAYFGNYDRLVYLAQTEDPSLDALARTCAHRLKLAYERRFTGFGDLFEFLSGAAKHEVSRQSVRSSRRSASNGI